MCTISKHAAYIFEYLLEVLEILGIGSSDEIRLVNAEL